VGLCDAQEKDRCGGRPLVAAHPFEAPSTDDFHDATATIRPRPAVATLDHGGEEREARRTTLMKKTVKAAVLVAVVATTSGCIVTQRDHDALAAKTAQVEKDTADARADVTALRAELEATRQRLDNALRASADSSGDTLASKHRLNDVAGRVDEVNHGLDELRKDVAASRTELYARLDELKRSQPAQPAPAAPAPILAPTDKAAHYKQLEEAFVRKDWPTVRALGPEYVNRYPSDDKADEAIFFVGGADLQDGRPSSALGQFNRLLKLFPRSNVLDRTLFSMGDAYLLMHDCVNAKVAYDACEKRFSKEKIGTEAKAKIDQIGKNPPGMCAPQ
jgi:TolA-binding protein